MGREELQAEYERILRRAGVGSALFDRPGPTSMGEGFDRSRALEVIRQLEAARHYDRWEDVATEPEANLLERLATIRRRRGPYLADHIASLAEVVQDQSAEVVGWAASCGWSPGYPLLTGVFPTGYMNAVSHPVPGTRGVLVLLHSGLMDFIFGFLKLRQAAASVFREPPLLDERQVGFALAELLNAYIFDRGAVKVQALPSVTGPRLSLLNFVLRRSEQFVIAHEMGHIIAGHLEDATWLAEPTLAGELDVAAYDRENEFEADAIAAEIMLSSLIDVPAEKRPEMETYLIGSLLLFFLLDVLVRVVCQEIGRPMQESQTHPASAERGMRLREHLECRDLSSHAFDIELDFVRWTDRQLPAAVEWLKRVEETMVRPGPGDLV